MKLKKYFIIFYIFSYNLQSKSENFIVISGYRADTETIKSSLIDYKTNCTSGIGAVTSFFVNALYQKDPINILVSGNILYNLLAHAKLFELLITNKLPTSIPNIIPQFSFLKSIQIDNIIKAALDEKDETINFHLTPDRSFNINSSNIIGNLNILQDVISDTIAYELLYRAPLEKYDLEISINKPGDIGNSVYLLKPKDEYIKKSELLTNKNIDFSKDILCDTNDSITEAIIKHITNANSIVIMNGHGSPNSGEMIVGISKNNFQKILTHFTNIKINLLFLISCYAAGRVFKEFNYTKSVVIQGIANKAIDICLPLLDLPMKFFLAGKTYFSYDNKTSLLITPKNLTHPINFYDFDIFFKKADKINNPNKFLEFKYENIFKTLIMNKYFTEIDEHNRQVTSKFSGPIDLDEKIPEYNSAQLSKLKENIDISLQDLVVSIAILKQSLPK